MPCLRTCIKFCLVFYTFRFVLLNLRTTDVHTNVFNYIFSTFAGSGSTFSRMFCQPDSGRSIDWCWLNGVDRLLDTQKSDKVLSDVKACGWSRWISLCADLIQCGTCRTVSHHSTGVTETILFAFCDYAYYNCRLLVWDSLYQQVRRTYFWIAHRSFGARGGAVGWGTALQTGRWRVRLPMMSFGIFY